MLISVVGAGYVGLVTAACLARLGNDVRVVDRNTERVERLSRADVPIHEPGLDQLVAEGLAAERLSFHTGLDATRGALFTIVAVGTLDATGRWTDSSVREAVRQSARSADTPRYIVVRSTLMPGIAVSIAEEATAIDPRVELALNPEFTREGSAVADFMAPDRVVIGVQDPGSPNELAGWLRQLYEPLGAPFVVTDLTSAEAIKVASNVFLAAKITFANELARLCAAAGADVRAVVDGMGLDRRIGRSFLSPGPGFGGSCFPSQSRALPYLAEQLGVRTPLMSAINVSNEDHATWYVDCVEAALGGSLEGTRVALLGLTFKAGTDDLRESPALRLARLFAGRGADLALYDPTGADTACALLAAERIDAEACASSRDACRGADVVTVATEWPEFGRLDWAELRGQMRGRLVLDTRAIVDADAAAEAGCEVLMRTARPPVRA